MGNSSKPQQIKQISLQEVSLENQRTNLVFAASVSTATIAPIISMIMTEDILKLILNLTDEQTLFALFSTCKYFRSPDSVKIFLSSIVASSDFQNQAISQFTAAALHYRGTSCFRLGVNFLVGDIQIVVPKGLSIHICTGSAEPRIKLHSVYWVILQVHGDEGDDSEIETFVKLLLKKELFENLQHLMLIGIPADRWLVSLLQNLNLTILSLKTFLSSDQFVVEGFKVTLSELSNLEKLYITHPDDKLGYVKCPAQLKEVVVYCPKSVDTTSIEDELSIDIRPCSSLRLLELHAHQKFKSELTVKFDRKIQLEKLKWNFPCSIAGRCRFICKKSDEYIEYHLFGKTFRGFKQVYVKRPMLKCYNEEMVDPPEFADELVESEHPSDTKYYYWDGKEMDNSVCECDECSIARKSLKKNVDVQINLDGST